MLTPQSNSTGVIVYGSRPQTSSTNINKYENKFENVTIPERKPVNPQALQIEHANILRQFCIFYHFYCVELFIQVNYVKLTMGTIDQYLRLLYVVGLLIKYKSTYSISIMSIHYK
jgi:hypothetical protein